MSDFPPGHEASSWQAMLETELEMQKRRRSRRVWLVVFVVALIVLVASLAALGVIAFSYLQGQQKYDEIAQTADFDASDVGEEAPLDTLAVDWKALKAANPDTVAWVYLPDSPINYPVVQGDDNEHYLYYDFDGDAGWLAEYGAIFLDCNNSAAFDDPVTFIYGHHMNDGSMFAVLSTLEDQAAFDAHRIIYVLTPKGNFRLRSFSLVHCAPDDPIVQTEFTRKKELVSYIQDKIDRSLVDAGKIPKAEEMGQVFAFATCDSNSAGRDVLFAYVLDTTAEGLSGEVGLDSNKNSTWFVDDLETEEDEKSSR